MAGYFTESHYENAVLQLLNEELGYSYVYLRSTKKSCFVLCSGSTRACQWMLWQRRSISSRTLKLECFCRRTWFLWTTCNMVFPYSTSTMAKSALLSFILSISKIHPTTSSSSALKGRQNTARGERSATLGFRSLLHLAP